MTDTPHEATSPSALETLAGFRIGVTSDRRSEDLIAAFVRRGAEVLHAPTIRIASTHDDLRLQADTRAIIEARPELLLATTSYGIRRWFESADAAGLGPALADTLAASRILVRGPKARGAVRAAGLDDAGMSDEETTESLVDAVIAEGAAGRTVAVQLHGFTDKRQLKRLEAAGARVLTAAPYRWERAKDSARVARLVEAIAAAAVDAVTFTSAPAAEALLDAADQAGRLDEVRQAFAGRVLAAAVGPVTAQPLTTAGIDPIVPDRFRMGALIKLVGDHLETRVVRHPTSRGVIELHGQLVVVGAARTFLPPNSLALFRALLDARGSVLSRAELRRELPDDPDDHAVDVAISRLRQALPIPGLVATVIKRGYRLDD